MAWQNYRLRTGTILIITYNNRARSLTLTSHVFPSSLPISPPPPLPSSSRTFHLLPHTRPILSISSHQFNSSSSSRNPRNKPFRSRVLLLHPTLLARPPPLMSVLHISSPSHFLSLL